MLTSMQKAILKMAAQEPKDVRSDRINDAIKLIKSQSPELFFHDTDKKADPAMSRRVFFDQPYSLLPDQYLRHVVPLTAVSERKKRQFQTLRSS